MQDAARAPDWRVSHWFNAPAPLSLASLRGRAVMVVAFQMLCPGCVSHGLPQAQRVRASFPESDVTILGLHTVFEHHDVMGRPEALAAFLHEYRIGFPVGIDEPDPERGLPRTMMNYGMRGTPTTLLFDRNGHLRLNAFGRVDDLRLGALIGAVLETDRPAAQREGGFTATESGCDDAGCAIRS